jgi:predicted CXXCH cytochrome family protein
MPSHVRRPIVFAVALALMALLRVPADAGSGDEVYVDSAHGDPVDGVDRDATLPIGSCQQCHTTTDVVGSTHPYGLFEANDNTLCFDCHAAATLSGVYAGETVFDGSDHWTSGDALWPGPNPPARDPGEEGLCLNCHTPHGSRDGLGLVPVLGYVREEALCVACHDLSGPASNVLGQINASSAHPIGTSGVHATDEGTTAASFGVGSRHAECVDCHNPHAGGNTGPLDRVSRISVTNGAAGTVPVYTAKAATDASAVEEYELCFKCHSAWTTLPVLAPDLSVETNPNNASFHPIQAAGKNTTAAMANSLAGGLGTPHLTTSSQITCSDCHGSEQLPTTVTTLSTYTGTIAVGPHGSRAGAGPAFSDAILRAPYRVTRPNNYVRGDYELCYICHSPAPFETTSENARSDTNFRYHGLHVFGEDSECKSCHYAPHGSEGAYWAGNRSYARGVSFGPMAQPTSGRSEPEWSPGTCYLRCHGENHNPETY